MLSSWCGPGVWEVGLKLTLPMVLLWQSGKAILLWALLLPSCGPVHRLVTWLIPIIGIRVVHRSMIVTDSRICRVPWTPIVAMPLNALV